MSCPLNAIVARVRTLESDGVRQHDACGSGGPFCRSGSYASGPVGRKLGQKAVRSL